MTRPQDDERTLHERLDNAIDMLHEEYGRLEHAAHDRQSDFDWTESEALTNSLHLEIQRLRDLIDDLDTLQPPGAM